MTNLRIFIAVFLTRDMMFVLTLISDRQTHAGTFLLLDYLSRNLNQVMKL